MRSLAQVLWDRGWRLSGSDTNVPAALLRDEASVRVFGFHAAEHVPAAADVVIASDAVAPDNPEICRAIELGIPTYSYFEALGQMMAERQGIAIAGTHGKSTTTAMLADVLQLAGEDPTVVFGAAPLGEANGGRAGAGSLMLAEACEYRANFLYLRPQQAVVLGIEPDHFDCYATPGELHEAFARFAQSIPADGLLLVRHDCRTSRRLARGLACRVQTFGFDPGADWSVGRGASVRGRWRFELYHAGSYVVDVSLQVPGWHNVLNALAAATVAWENGVEGATIAAGLGAFRGLHRRLEVMGAWRGVTLIDDYAHHPTEVTATLAAVRRMYPGRRLWCVLQPHQASRTKHLLDELAASLQNADRVIVADIYRAREPEVSPGDVTAADLAAKVRQGRAHVADVHATAEILGLLEKQLESGDVLVTMGAGDIRKIGHGLIDGIREDRAAG
ncbi:MAG: UDP-N-acetylmuramate--L-alanine ligase [Pirellulales bacterium]|nr:UDP-N-acetylmuramate--L-alanine ligase [Pirellulales bacterium]